MDAVTKNLGRVSGWHLSSIVVIYSIQNMEHKQYRKEEYIYTNEGAFANATELSALSPMAKGRRIDNSSLEPFLSEQSPISNKTHSKKSLQRGIICR